MKTFIEEYGITVVIAIILTMLIGVAVIFRTQGKNSILGIIDNFQNASQLECVENYSESEAGLIEPTVTLNYSGSGRENWNGYDWLADLGDRTYITVVTNSSGAITVSGGNGNASVNGNEITIPFKRGGATYTITIAETEQYASKTIEIEICGSSSGG